MAVSVFSKEQILTVDTGGSTKSGTRVHLWASKPGDSLYEVLSLSEAEATFLANWILLAVDRGDIQFNDSLLTHSYIDDDIQKRLDGRNNS